MLQIAVDRLAKLRIDEVMNARRRLGIESAQLLETAACAGFESLPAFADAMLDGRVVADVEMEKGPVFGSSPIAAIQHVRAAHIKSSRDNPPLPLGKNQAHVLRESL